MTTPEITKKKSSTARQQEGLEYMINKRRTAKVIGNSAGGIGLRHEGKHMQDI